MEDINHILNLLEEARIAVNKEDSSSLKRLSDQTVHSASVYQDEDDVLTAVFIYSLGKTIEKGRKYYKQDYEKYLSYYLKTLENLINSIKKNKHEIFHKEIKKVTESEEFSNEFRRHATELFRKARINKASRVYEHGLSMERTAKLLGISLWELAEYSGQTDVNNVKESVTFSVKDRIKKAMEIFK